jgi:hypothetical protein
VREDKEKEKTEDKGEGRKYAMGRFGVHAPHKQAFQSAAAGTTVFYPADQQMCVENGWIPGTNRNPTPSSTPRRSSRTMKLFGDGSKVGPTI